MAVTKRTLLLLVSLAVLESVVGKRHQQPVYDEEEEEEEEIKGALVKKVGGDLLVEWTAGATYDFATADHRGKCVISSPTLNTWYGRGGHRTVDSDLLRLCEQRPFEYTTRASKKRKWNVHATHWTLFSDCLFEFEWQFVDGATLYDCSPDAIIAKNGEAAYHHIRKTYPKDEFFSLYVGGIRIAVTDCDLNRHKGYVKVYPSLPRQAYSSNAGTRENYEQNPVFFVNVEGWTGGDCSGSKGPGVRWVFTYKVNLDKARISYVSKFTEGTHRPYAEVASYVPHLESGGRTPTKKYVLTYEEKTKGFAEELGILLDG